MFPRRLILACLLAVAGTARAQSPDTLDWIQEVLTDWENTCRLDLRIALQPVPWIIVYDSARAWHVNPDLTLLPETRRKTRHQLRFAGRRYRIYESLHSGKLWVPGRDPIDLPKHAYTMPYSSGAKAFFVIGAPEYLVSIYGEQARSKSFRDLWRGLAMHELAHTRQVPQLMPVLDGLRKRYRLPESFDDNLIETTFSGNAAFSKLFDETQAHLMAAILATSDGPAREHARAPRSKPFAPGRGGSSPATMQDGERWRRCSCC